MDNLSNQRRNFLRNVRLGSLSIVVASNLISACHEDEDKEVSPPEDLMQEHGLLNRVLSIYGALATFCTLLYLGIGVHFFAQIVMAAPQLREILHTFYYLN